MNNYLASTMLFLISLPLILLPLAPISLEPKTFGNPDLITCLICGWIVRRPTTTPTSLVIIISLIADIFWMKPLGLWTILLLLSSEIIKSRRIYTKNISFLYEILAFCLLYSLMNFGLEIILVITFTETFATQLRFTEFLFTILAYPLIILFIKYILQIKFEEFQAYEKVSAK